MEYSTTRYQTTVSDGIVSVISDSDEVVIGDVETIVELVGGPTWTITYAEQEKQNYPGLDTSDEGLMVDVVDTVHAMTFDESFVETLKAQPGEPISNDAVSPRLGLFAGRLLENLAYGVR